MQARNAELADDARALKREMLALLHNTHYIITNVRTLLLAGFFMGLIIYRRCLAFYLRQTNQLVETSPHRLTGRHL